jgi:hypothetical protein
VQQHLKKVVKIRRGAMISWEVLHEDISAVVIVVFNESSM